MKQGFAGSLLLITVLIVPWANSQAGQTHVEPSVYPTDTVVLNVVVHDKKSKSVTDLKPEDLAVTDDGSPVTLSSLRSARRRKRTGTALQPDHDEG
jgi:hypothetical protein